MDRDRIALRSHPENILLLSWGGGTASFGAAARVPEFPRPPSQMLSTTLYPLTQWVKSCFSTFDMGLKPGFWASLFRRLLFSRPLPSPTPPNVQHHSLPTDSVGKELLLNI